MLLIHVCCWVCTLNMVKVVFTQRQSGSICLAHKEQAVWSSAQTWGTLKEPPLCPHNSQRSQTIVFIVCDVSLSLSRSVSLRLSLSVCRHVCVSLTACEFWSAFTVGVSKRTFLCMWPEQKKKKEKLWGRQWCAKGMAKWSWKLTISCTSHFFSLAGRLRLTSSAGRSFRRQNAHVGSVRTILSFRSAKWTTHLGRVHGAGGEQWLEHQRVSQHLIKSQLTWLQNFMAIFPSKLQQSRQNGHLSLF